jgi:pimeloyl-ACP methyl ester carboxylesterase
MIRGSARRTQAARRELVIALHCSDLVAPEHYGCDSTGPWPGEHAFTLADEAARTIALIDGTGRQVHLVGHSYGGGVALHVALARPERIASLTLYEPSAFHLLWQLDHAAAALTEIKAIAYAVATGVVTGDYRSSAATFVDYWGGPGAWAAMRPSAQDAIVRWMPMAPPEFSALFKEPTLARDYARLRFPTLVIRGEHAPAPTRLIAEALPLLSRSTRLAVVAGASHMGPLTHAADVNALIAAQIAEASAPSRAAA